MKRKSLTRVLWTLFILISLSVSVGWAHRVGGEQASSPPSEFVPGEVLIKFRPGVAPTVAKDGVKTGVGSLDAVFREYGVMSAEPLFPRIGHSSQGLERIYKLTLPPTADVHSVIRALIPDTHVEYAEPNYVFHINDVPSQGRSLDAGGSNSLADDRATRRSDLLLARGVRWSSEVNRSAIYAITNDGTETKVVDVPFSNMLLPQLSTFITLSPDGRYLTYVTTNGPGMRDARLWLVDLSNGSKRVLAIFPKELWIAPLVWSPTGKSIAFTKITMTPSGGHGIGLWIIDVMSGKQTLIVSDPSFRPSLFYVPNLLSTVRWTADGSSIVYTDYVTNSSSKIEYKVDLKSRMIHSTRHSLSITEKRMLDEMDVLPCEVIPFSQHDASWKDEIMQRCALTIGEAGCALTSVAMSLRYYGVETNPHKLNQCLGSYACPISWGKAASDCGENKANYSGSQPFSWSAIETSLSSKHPIVVGLEHSSGPGGDEPLTHFVLAVSGHGTTAEEYRIVDPADGRIKQLSIYTDEGWRTASLHAYDGTPWCEGTVSGKLPNDPYFSYQWGLNNTRQTGGEEDADIDAPEAWTIVTGTSNVMVAVIDTGVDYLHEDLSDGRVRTDIDKDYVNDDNNAIDDNGHGTHVSGIIAAETNNDTGVAGVMWQAQILPLKVCDSKGSCASDDVSSAIRYAADQGARVINMSLGSGHCSETMAEAVNYAYFDKGVTIVAAAGNNGGSIGYPARFAPVIAVGATDDSDHRASFSSFGDDLDVMAPGVDILSTVPHNGYDFLSGTSMASPHVAGVVGLLLSQRPQLTNSQIREILHESADDLGDKGRDDYYGYGRVNAYKALQTATPQNAKDPDKASCPDEVCGATAALSEEPNGKNILADLKAVRDKVFTQDPGRRWARIYYKHQFEVAWLLATHGDLRANAKAGFRAFDPVFHALLDDSRTNGPVILTPELIQAARLALMGVAENGSPALHDDIVREWNRVDPERFVGQDVRDVWKQLCAEEHRGWVYLPVVTK